MPLTTPIETTAISNAVNITIRRFFSSAYLNMKWNKKALKIAPAPTKINVGVSKIFFVSLPIAHCLLKMITSKLQDFYKS